MNIFESLKNSNISEECFSYIINEVSDKLANILLLNRAYNYGVAAGEGSKDHDELRKKFLRTRDLYNKRNKRKKPEDREYEGDIYLKYNHAFSDGVSKGKDETSITPKYLMRECLNILEKYINEQSDSKINATVYQRVKNFEKDPSIENKYKAARISANAGARIAKKISALSNTPIPQEVQDNINKTKEAVEKLKGIYKRARELNKTASKDSNSTNLLDNMNKKSVTNDLYSQEIDNNIKKGK